MKPPYTTPIHSITQNCCYVPQGSNVIFIAKNHKFAVSTITIAAALEMHGIPWICASYPGACAQLELALGAQNVVSLPVWSIHPQSPDLAEPIKRARKENAVLIIDAQVDPSFEFGRLPDALNLLRGDTLSIVLSIVESDYDVPDNGRVWSCRPDRCVAHVLGTDPGNQTAGDFEFPWELMPTWYSGEITHGMDEVLSRRGAYRDLPPIPELPGMFLRMPDHSRLRQDRNVHAVVEMLASARDESWKTIFDAFVEEMM